MPPIRAVVALAAVTLAAGTAVLLLRPDAAPVQEVAVVQPTATPTPTPSTVRVATPSPRPTAVPVPTLGADVSWPNCPLGTPGALPGKQPQGLGMPGPQVQFVVIGLTNGPGFYPNPCLASQVAEARRRHLLTAAYAFTTLPNAAQIKAYGDSGPYSRSTALGRLRNAADAQARVNVRSLRRTGLRTPIVWMDVEPQPYLSPWGTDVTANRAVIHAVQAAYHRAGYRTGFYSAPYAWEPITGGMQDSSPTWVTAGPRGRAAAAAKCSARSFSGGPVALSQFWVENVMDYDVLCAPVRADVTQWFATN